MKGGGNGAATTTTALLVVALLVVLVAASPVQMDAAVAAVRRLGAGGDAPVGVALSGLPPSNQCTSDPSKKGSTCYSPPSGKEAAAQAEHQSPPLVPASVALTGPKISNCTYGPDPRDPTRCLIPPSAP